jgi:hypothetical protein
MRGGPVDDFTLCSAAGGVNCYGGTRRGLSGQSVRLEIWRPRDGRFFPESATGWGRFLWTSQGACGGFSRNALHGEGSARTSAVLDGATVSGCGGLVLAAIGGKTGAGDLVIKSGVLFFFVGWEMGEGEWFLV